MKDIKHLLERYLNNSLPKEEKKYIDDWLTETENPVSEWKQLENGQRQQFISNLHTDILSAINTKKAKITPLNRRTIWRSIAASIVLLLAIGWFVWNSKKDDTHHQSFVVFNSKKGQKHQLRLADGSIVWLNESSTLRYSKTFSGNTREVWLDGEAYFDIFRDSLKRFIVHAGQINTTVLGTAFNIRSNMAANYFAISVLRGKVSVSTKEKQLLGEVEKNENLVFNNGALINKTKIDSVKKIEWLPQDLMFDDITLAEVIHILEQRYSKHIKLNDPRLGTCRFSGSASVSASLDDVLSTICAFNKLTYHYQGDDIILINGVGCN